jgi:hypothetical protein
VFCFVKLIFEMFIFLFLIIYKICSYQIISGLILVKVISMTNCRHRGPLTIQRSDNFIQSDGEVRQHRNRLQ